jgi:hypothetical protein
MILARYLLLLIGALASPVAAQTLEGVWKNAGDRIAAPPVNVSFPRSIGGLTLTKTSEASRKGDALDNEAEYHSADHAIWGTIYVYRPGYPDAAIAAYMTDRAIRQIYGSGLKRLSQTVAPIGGKAGAAIRVTYSGGVLKDSGVLASAAAFARVNGWILVFRVSGPINRQTDVEATLDAMLLATKFGAKAYVLPAAPLDFAAPCPAASSGPVKPIKSKDSNANTLMAALGGAITNEPPTKDDPLPPAFPANGLTKVCVRGTYGDTGLEILQPAGEAQPDIILLPLNDTDDVISIQKNLMGKGYTLGKAEIGRTTVFGEMDRLPDNGELVRILTGKEPELLKTRSSTEIKSSGDTNVNIDPDTLK